MSRHPQLDVCCLLGDPVAGNPTQYMLEKAFSAASLDWRFLTFEVSAVDFEGALRGARIFGFRGVMLAPPHRGRVLPLLEQVTEAARISGQVNCIHQRDGQLRGHNTEGQALRRLAEGMMSLTGSSAVILGSGRLARSIAAELALAGVSEMTFVCVDPDEAAPLVESLQKQTSLTSCRVEPWPQEGRLNVADMRGLLINATPVGRNDPDALLPVDVESLPSGMVVADVVYNPPQTALIRAAKQRGLGVVDGLKLLVEQAAVAFEIWTGQTADREAMRDAVEEFLVL
ncbi:MAG: shikimate dehydrogenase [Planctomycetales bacterium]|nr:shikimate dehydrogenase [Planctomycetales bacterium]